jgi:hypothetical protein
MMVLQHKIGTPPTEMVKTLRTAAERVEQALLSVDLSDLPLANYDLDLFTALEARGIPTYPVQVGDRVLTCHSDTIEAVERACHATALGQYAYDVAGRAFEIVVDVRLAFSGEHSHAVPE